MDAELYKFGPYKISSSEVFHSTPLSYAFVNLRPVVPGHVLVCPRREVKRFIDLTAEETSDLCLTAKDVGAKLERYHEASSLTFSIQDGPQAGQTVPHVHIHILPRKKIDVKEKKKLDIERKDRSSDEMAHEAEQYRALFS